MRAFGKLRPRASFATAGFDGIHAYWLVNGDGERAAFRSREVVAGRLQITGVAPHADTLEREVFDPTRVPDGVELSDDPVLRFRGHVYRLSAERRRAGR